MAHEQPPRQPPPKWSRRQTNAAMGLGTLGLALWIGTAVLRATTQIDIDLGVLPPALFFLGCYVVFNLKAGDILDFFAPSNRQGDRQ